MIEACDGNARYRRTLVVPRRRVWCLQSYGRMVLPSHGCTSNGLARGLARYVHCLLLTAQGSSQASTSLWPLTPAACCGALFPLTATRWGGKRARCGRGRWPPTPPPPGPPISPFLRFIHLFTHPLMGRARLAAAAARGQRSRKKWGTGTTSASAAFGWRTLMWLMPFGTTCSPCTARWTRPRWTPAWEQRQTFEHLWPRARLRGCALSRRGWSWTRSQLALRYALVSVRSRPRTRTHTSTSTQTPPEKKPAQMTT